MSKRCELTGISPLKGHNVSHAKNKTKPNAQGEASRMKAPDNIKNLERYILKLHLKVISSKRSNDFLFFLH